MSAICLIDTSIFLNIPQVPNRSNDHVKVDRDFREYINLGMTFILPMATILETGNHVAQNGNGALRRKTATRFVDAVKSTFNGSAPWTPSEFPNMGEISTWIERFPACAGANKAPGKPNEGTSFGDLSIIEEYQKCIRRFPLSEIFIWSLDSDLSQFSTAAR